MSLIRCLPVAQVFNLFLLMSISVTVCNAADQLPLDHAIFDPKPDATVPAINDTQVTNIPYFTLRDGMSSTLTLNNLAPSATTVKVTIFNLEGWSQVLAPIRIGAHSYTQVSLRSVVIGEEFDSGNIEIAYTGAPMAVTCQVSIFSVQKRISFEAREQERMDFMSSISSGIVWLPQATAKGFLAVTNVAAQDVSIRSTAGVRGESFSLRPHQTRLLELNNDLAKQAQVPFAALVKLRHNGRPGDIITSGFVLDVQNGYSSSFSMVDSVVMVSRQLAGVHFRFGRPDPTEGFPENTYFKAPLLVANVTRKPVHVQVFVNYTIDAEEQDLFHSSKDVRGHVLLKKLAIGPSQIAQIDLSDELHRLGVSQSVKDSGIDISYDARPGAVIAQLTSADQTGNYAFDVPIKDPSAMNEQMEGNYPWALGAGNQAIVHFKNTTGSAVQVLLVFNFPGGGLYNPAPLILRPFQSASLDIQKLKTSKKRDFYGRPFPDEAMRGQLQWHQVVPYSIVARLEQTNIARGIAQSFSCGANCCSYYTEGGHVSPSSISGNVGATATLVATISGRDCMNNPYVKAATRVTFTSSNTNVATVNSITGSVKLVGAGQATIFADFSIASYDFNANELCVVHYDTVRFNIPVNPTPTITGSNTVWWFNNQNPPGYATSITVTSSGGSPTTWSVTSGANKVTLSSTTGASITVRSSGTPFSSAVGDIKLTATAYGATSQPFAITTRTPKDLVQPSVFTQCDAGFGYDTTISYIARDQLTSPMTAGIDYNEQWTTGRVPVYSGTNWPQNPVGPGSNPGQYLIDDISGPGVNNSPPNIPQPTCNVAAVEVVKWGQAWRIGSQTSGLGVLVQTDTLHKYNVKGAHTIP